MSTIANWNGHTFEISSQLIRTFDKMTIKGACETTDKNTNKQKYVERKFGESPVITMTVGLNAQLGVDDVMSEAMEFVNEATQGATAYFYMGTRKLFPAQMILVNAEVAEIAHMPGKGDQWVSCDVNLTFKQGTKDDGAVSYTPSPGTGTGGNGEGNGDAGSPNAPPQKSLLDKAKEKLNKVKDLLNNAKEKSKEKLAGLLKPASGESPARETVNAPQSSSKIDPTRARDMPADNKATALLGR